jgi:hypothetical protein
LLDEKDHLFEVIDILAMNDQIYGEGDLVAADNAGELDLVGVSFGSGNPVGGGFARILKADLDVIEAGVNERLQARLGKADAGGDQIGVKAGGARSGGEFGEIGAGEWFAASEVRVQHP